MKGSALAARCDVLHRDEVHDLVARVETAVGPVDLLVNNAGQFGPVRAIATLDPDEWWQALEVNLRGPLNCTRAVLPDMLRRGHGRIINVSSSSGLAAVPMLSAYSVSKAALCRLSENLAAETRGHRVSVFTIIPGLVRTAMSESALSCGEPSIERFKGAFAQQENFSAEPAASLVVYLATGATDVLSGRYIFATDDEPQMVSRANDIQEQGLYVLRGRPQYH